MSLFFYCKGAIIIYVVFFFFFKQKTAYEIGTGDWSSDVCLPLVTKTTLISPTDPVFPAVTVHAYLPSVSQLTSSILRYEPDVCDSVGRLLSDKSTFLYS